MSWLLLAIGATLAGGGLSWLIIRFVGRDRRWLRFALPLVLFLATQMAAFQIALRTATCNQPDCGALIFVAALLFAGTISIGALVGSIIGVWLAARRQT